MSRNFIGIEKENEFIKISVDRKVELDKNRKEIEANIKDLQVVKQSLI